MKKKSNSPIELQDWDVSFFRKNIARLVPGILSERVMADALRECKKEKVDCLFARLESDVQKNVRIAEKNGFSLMSTRASYEAEFRDTREVDVAIRPALHSDLPTLKRMARVLSRESRFFRDPVFGVRKAERLYEAWVESLLSDHRLSGHVMIAMAGQRAAGFVATSKKGPLVHIELIFVDEQFRGRSIGRGLLQACINTYVQSGPHRFVVATQGSNVPAQRLYQSFGFKITKMELDYHKWFN
ncbi:MAG: GNAT family N-acetyltransferase [bacterium]|nr:GNAT family N-acetyltransferase [bacterium]